MTTFLDVIHNAFKHSQESTHQRTQSHMRPNVCKHNKLIPAADGHDGQTLNLHQIHSL